ncbi:MAG: glycosyltransferase family 2 protein [Patescibacteria group bacterium]
MSKVSVIIVKYRAQKELQQCLKSLPKKLHELIIVDNNKINRGYAKGNNLGAKKSTGDYLFILNPDTILFPNTLSHLVSFLDSHPQAAIVAPLLLDANENAYPLQGTSQLTPMAAIFSLSFIYKFWPGSQMACNYWLKTWDKKSPKEVDVIPGTAFLIRRKVFEQVGGFDANFFLYFEESDLCKRVKELGYDIWINPQAQLIHHWGKSTPHDSKTQKIFVQSRKHYFTKHFGKFSSFMVELFCNPKAVLK